MQSDLHLTSSKPHRSPGSANDLTYAYVVYVRSAFIATIVLSTALTWLSDPSSVATSMWFIVLGATVFQTALAVVTRRRPARARVTATIACIADMVLVVCALPGSPYPLSSSAIVTFLVVIAALVLTPRWSIAYTIACALSITVASHNVDDWGEPYYVPSTAFVTLLAGSVAAFFAHRMHRIEESLAHEAVRYSRARERLELVDASRHRLIANVSHELRTPLTSTIGSIETLLREDVDVPPEQHRQLLLIARQGGLRLLGLVEDLLTIGTTRPDALELRTGPEPLVQLVRDALAGIDPDGRALDVVATDDPLVSVDRMRMLQVVTNLVVNAVRHGEGAITIEVAAMPDHATVRVLDEGNGVPPDYAEEMFLPFARFSTRDDSTGLGLAICRTIVDAHDGELRYERTDDERTCFHLMVPLAIA